MIIKDENVGDITAATGIYFYLLLTLFLRINFLKATVTSVVNWYNLSLIKLVEIAHSVTSMVSFKMKVTGYKYKGLE